jgi:hypothetical protein
MGMYLPNLAARRRLFIWALEAGLKTKQPRRWITGAASCGRCADRTRCLRIRQSKGYDQSGSFGKLSLWIIRAGRRSDPSYLSPWLHPVFQGAFPRFPTHQGPLGSPPGGFPFQAGNRAMSGGCTPPNKLSRSAKRWAAIFSTSGLAEEACSFCDAFTFHAKTRYCSARSMKVFLSSARFANNALRSHSSAFWAKSLRFRRFRRLVIRSTSRRVSSASFCQYLSESCASSRILSGCLSLPIL